MCRNFVPHHVPKFQCMLLCWTLLKFWPNLPVTLDMSSVTWRFLPVWYWVSKSSGAVPTFLDARQGHHPYLPDPIVDTTKDTEILSFLVIIFLHFQCVTFKTLKQLMPRGQNTNYHCNFLAISCHTWPSCGEFCQSKHLLNLSHQESHKF